MIIINRILLSSHFECCVSMNLLCKVVFGHPENQVFALYYFGIFLISLKNVIIYTGGEQNEWYSGFTIQGMDTFLCLSYHRLTLTPS